MATKSKGLNIPLISFSIMNTPNMNIGRYDTLVANIHQRYEQLYSVVDRPTLNNGKSWRTRQTLGGIITHSDRYLEDYDLGPSQITLDQEGIQKSRAMDIARKFLIEKYFQNDQGSYWKAEEEYQKMYSGAQQSGSIPASKLINATRKGRQIPLEHLVNEFGHLQRVRHRDIFQPFFVHETFKEYLEEAIEYFQENGVSLKELTKEHMREKWESRPRTLTVPKKDEL
jgi:hypothetical protein|tara:strand:- start:353 stop:1033 length:681 start_codon:yes stop_codon:yes gene_type:complete